jgi:serine/threonine protein kinase
MASGLLDPEFLIGASLAEGRFKVVARIGAGSMAVVYRAFDHRLETDVVVKVPKKQKLEDPGLRERFNRESRLLVQLQHPHIVRILDIGLHSNVPYVVMQYLSGGCLLDRMVGRNGQPSAMKLPSLRDWVQPVAKALDYAHQQKIVHRDVKPANIMFDHAGNAFLGDFGLTKIMHGDPSEDEANETAAGFVVGTPNYVAPEIVLGKDYDGRADQYSLAITIYHALIGQPPMLGKSPSATMVNQTRRVLPLLNEVRKTVPTTVAEAVARSLAKNPQQRFSTCSELADAVIFGLSSSPASSDNGSSSVTRQSISDKNDSTTREFASGSETPSQGYSRVASSDSRVTKRPGSKAVRQAVASRPGVFACPVCSRQLKLRPEHAGRVGRCVQCQTRLSIAADLKLIRVLEDIASSESNVSSSSGNDLLVGDSLFGFRLGRRTLLVVGGVMLLSAIVGVALFFNQLTGVDLKKEEQRIRMEYQNREGG